MDGKQIKTPHRAAQTARKPIPCDYIHSLIVQPENAGDKSRVLSWLLRKWEEEEHDLEYSDRRSSASA